LICFYRRCDSLIADALSKNPWGLGDTDFWRHFTAGQGNSVATNSDIDSLCEFLSLPPASRVSPPTAPSAGPPCGAPRLASADRIPPGIRQRVNELHSRLGYSAL
jgi:hypothetical protein